MAFVSWSTVPASAPELQGPWLIYALLDPGDDCVRYVGVTGESLPARLAGHRSQPTNRKMREWISKLANANQEPVIRLLIAVDHGWQRAERAWIAWFLKRGELLNVDPGGLCRDKSGRLIPAMSKPANIDWRPVKFLRHGKKRKKPKKVDPWGRHRYSASAKAAELSKRQMGRR
jgi:hypothetical protein